MSEETAIVEGEEPSMEDILSSITSFTTNKKREELDEAEEQKIHDELKRLGYL